MSHLLRSVVGVIGFNMHNVNKLSNAFRFVCLFCSGSGWMNNAHCDFLEEQTRNTPVYTLWKSMHRPTRQRHLLRHIRSDPTSCWRHHYIINFSKPGALWTRENWAICWPHFDCGGDLDTSSWCLFSDKGETSERPAEFCHQKLHRGTAYAPNYGGNIYLIYIRYYYNRYLLSL